MNWANSDRRSRLPRDWPKRVAAIKARAHGRCQATEHVANCDGIGTDCDHIIQNDDHTLSNLQLLSRPCHMAKTLAAQSPKRKTPRHPGLL